MWHQQRHDDTTAVVAVPVPAAALGGVMHDEDEGDDGGVQSVASYTCQ